MVEFNLNENLLTCVFATSRMDTENCLNVEKEISQQTDKDDIEVIFDLVNIEYIASAFLRICVKTSKNVGKNNFKVINISPNVKKVFKISGFDKLLNIE